MITLRIAVAIAIASFVAMSQDAHGFPRSKDVSAVADHMIQYLNADPPRVDEDETDYLAAQMGGLRSVLKFHAKAIASQTPKFIEVVIDNDSSEDCRFILIQMKAATNGGRALNMIMKVGGSQVDLSAPDNVADCAIHHDTLTLWAAKGP